MPEPTPPPAEGKTRWQMLGVRQPAEVPELPQAPYQGRTYWQLVWRQFRKNRMALMAGGVVLVLFTLAIFAPFIASGHPLYARITKPEQYRNDFDGWEVSHGDLVSDLRAGRRDKAAEYLANCRIKLGQLAVQLDGRPLERARALLSAYGEDRTAAGAAERLETLGKEARAELSPRKVTLVHRSYFPLFRQLSWLDLFFMTLYFVVAAYFLFARRRVDRWIERRGVDPFQALFVRLLAVLALPAAVALVWGLALPAQRDPTSYQARALEPREGDRIVFPPIPYSPDVATTGSAAAQPPSWSRAEGGGTEERRAETEFAPHVLGTDARGYDVAAMMVWGARVSLSVGFVSVSIYLAIGIVVGALAGYFMGWVDALVSRVIEVVICFPSLFLIIIIMAYLQPSVYMVMLVIGVTGWPGVSRLVRGEFIRLGNQEFVIAARALGLGAPRIIFRHVLPNALAPVLVVAAFGIAGAILTESALSYLGIGVPPATPSWGSLLKAAKDDPRGRWWLTLFPGFAVFIAVTGYNLLAEGIRDAIDPRLKE